MGQNGTSTWFKSEGQRHRASSVRDRQQPKNATASERIRYGSGNVVKNLSQAFRRHRNIGSAAKERNARLGSHQRLRDPLRTTGYEQPYLPVVHLGVCLVACSG